MVEPGLILENKQPWNTSWLASDATCGSQVLVKTDYTTLVFFFMAHRSEVQTLFKEADAHVLYLRAAYLLAIYI